VRRWRDREEVSILLCVEASSVPVPETGTWRKCLDSAEERWHGPGSTLPDAIACDAVGESVAMSALSVALYRRES